MFVLNNAFIPTIHPKSRNISCNRVVRIERKGQAEVTTECSKSRQVFTGIFRPKSAGETKVRSSSIWLSQIKPHKVRKCVKCDSIKPSLEGYLSHILYFFITINYYM